MSNGSNEILREIPHLSDAELHVYRYILAHARDIPSMSVHTLAALTNTSTATILRLCRKYGCRTFPEFKLCLEEELACQPDADLREYGSGSHNLSYFFSRTLNDPSFDDSLNKAAELLARCSQIIFLGDGSSNIVCDYAAMYFSYQCRYASRVEDVRNYAPEFFFSSLPENTCITALSVTGENPHIIHFLQRPHSRSLKIIAITDDAESMLASIADVSISYNIPITMFHDSNLTSQVPAVYIVEELSRRTHQMLSSDR